MLLKTWQYDYVCSYDYCLKLEQTLRTRSRVLRIFFNKHKQLGTC